jgi:arsenate reductase (thioredoxin)
MKEKVVFVCLHGAAKSVIAAELYKRRAAQAGQDVEVTALGLEPDPEVAPGAARGLLAEGIDVRGLTPRAVTAVDLADAGHVVAFGCDLSAVARPGLAVEQWPDVPAVSDGYAAARASIGDHVERLIAARRATPQEQR